MSANKLLKLIENSKEKIVKPNDCYNSGIINAEYKRTSGIPKTENIQISICYGKPKLFVFWLNGKEILNETISTSKMIFEDGFFKTKYYTLKIN
jgi:hypothetical protein